MARKDLSKKGRKQTAIKGKLEMLKSVIKYGCLRSKREKIKIVSDSKIGWNELG